MTEPIVRNNPARSRFELETEFGMAVANYHAADGVIAIYHTEVPPQLRERGIASRMIHDVLELIRADGLKVAARCGFVAHYLKTHPEFHDLVG